MLPFTEDALVQQTTADYLEQQLGWASVYDHNSEDFGPDGLLGRASDREVVLTRRLRERLAMLNPDLPDDAYDDAVRQMTAVASQSMVAANREKYELTRDGVPVVFRNAKGERVRARLRVFDFETAENNDFLCVRELWVRGDLYRRRPDIIGFVNGLPLLFIECKNIHRNLKAAFMETLLKGVCNARDFMDIVENFILFDESSGEPKKILARNHQFLGVNRAIETVIDRAAEDPYPYDISQIDFDLLKREFERSREKNTTVQNLKRAVEQQLQRLLRQNLLRTNFQHLFIHPFEMATDGWGTLGHNTRRSD